MEKDLSELIQSLSKQLTNVSDTLSRKAEDALKEAQNSGKLTETTKVEVDKLVTAQTALSGVVDTLTARIGEVEQKGARRQGGEPSAHRSVGAQLVASEAAKNFAKSVEGGRRVSVPVTNVTTSLEVAPGVVEPQRLPGIDVAPKQRLFIRDLIAPGRTTSPAIFWVQQTGFTNNARVVAENTKKPYSDIQFGTKITPVVTIAHMFKASKQIMDDFAQLQSTVDAEMRYGLKQVEEAEVLFGSGGSSHLEGIVPQASAFNPAFVVEDATRIDTLRLAILQAQLARLPATGFVIHMTDWAGIELTKDKNGGYVMANPLRLAGPTLWGLPVVETDAPEFLGDFLAGAFATGAQIFDREEANVVLSTENVDDFEKNMVSIRCEERLALAVKRPEAFVTGSFTASVTP